MTVEQQATQDIKDDLWQNSKCFIAFKKKLNPIMKKIVNSYIKQQENARTNIQNR